MYLNLGFGQFSSARTHDSLWALYKASFCSGVIAATSFLDSSSSRVSSGDMLFYQFDVDGLTALTRDRLEIEFQHVIFFDIADAC